MGIAHQTHGITFLKDRTAPLLEWRYAGWTETSLLCRGQIPCQMQVLAYLVGIHYPSGYSHPSQVSDLVLCFQPSLRLPTEDPPSKVTTSCHVNHVLYLAMAPSEWCLFWWNFFLWNWRYKDFESPQCSSSECVVRINIVPLFLIFKIYFLFT